MTLKAQSTQETDNLAAIIDNVALDNTSLDNISVNSNAQSSAQLSYRHAFMLVLKRDLTIAMRHKDDIINPLLFFVIVITLFPLGIGPEAQTLSRIAPGIIWVAALLATLLSLDRLFKSDHLDGSLEQMLLSPHPIFYWY